MELLIITKTFANKNKGKTANIEGANYVFDYRITIDNKYVCSSDYLITMPELFEGVLVKKGNFEQSDFPQDET